VNFRLFSHDSPSPFPVVLLARCQSPFRLGISAPCSLLGWGQQPPHRRPCHSLFANVSRQPCRCLSYLLSIPLNRDRISDMSIADGLVSLTSRPRHISFPVQRLNCLIFQAAGTASCPIAHLFGTDYRAAFSKATRFPFGRPTCVPFGRSASFPLYPTSGDSPTCFLRPGLVHFYRTNTCFSISAIGCRCYLYNFLYRYITATTNFNAPPALVRTLPCPFRAADFTPTEL
jgi:hypothetical protein